MKRLQFSLKLAVLLGLAAISPTFGAKNAHSQTLAAEQAPTVLIRDISTTPTLLKTRKKSLIHQNMQLGTIPVGNSSAPVVIAAIPVGVTITLVVIGGIILIVAIVVSGLVIIGNDEVGIVIKKLGRPIPINQLIARKGEAGPQEDTLSSGWH